MRAYSHSSTARSVTALRSLSVLAVASAGVLGVTACTPAVPGASSSSGGTSSSTFNLVLGAELDTLDPAKALTSTARQVDWLAYESLVRVDPATGKSSPSIASSWTFTPTSMHFVIAPGHKCADGSEITAGTIQRNFERWKNKDTNAPLVNNMFGSSDFTVTSDDTARTVDVTMTTAQPFINDVPSMTTFPVSCDAGLKDPTKYAKGSDGTGPYTITDYVNGSHVTLTRNDSYNWGPSGTKITDLPQKVQVKLLSDANTQANLLLSGDADAAALTGDPLSRVQNQSTFQQTLETQAAVMLMFNERSDFATADIAVRKALAQALDRTQVAQVQTNGASSAADYIRPAGKVCVDVNAIKAAIPTGGVDAAKATLTAAGYTAGSDGVMQKDGKALKITLLAGELTNSAAAELVISNWKQAGFDVTYDNRAAAQAETTFTSGAGWDVAFFGMSTDLPTGFRPFIIGPASPSGPNFGAVSNSDYAKYQAQASKLTGSDACPLWIQAETSIVSHVDWIPTIDTQTKWVTRKGVSMFTNASYIDPLTLRKQ